MKEKECFKFNYFFLLGMDFLDSLVLASELECAFECREEPDRLVERDRDLADSFLPN